MCTTGPSPSHIPPLNSRLSWYTCLGPARHFVLPGGDPSQSHCVWTASIRAQVHKTQQAQDRAPSTLESIVQLARWLAPERRALQPTSKQQSQFLTSAHGCAGLEAREAALFAGAPALDPPAPPLPPQGGPGWGTRSSEAPRQEQEGCASCAAKAERISELRWCLPERPPPPPPPFALSPVGLPLPRKHAPP